MHRSPDGPRNASHEGVKADQPPGYAYISIMIKSVWGIERDKVYKRVPTLGEWIKKIEFH